MTITESIKNLVKYYESGGITAQEINNGECCDFAEPIPFGETIWGDELCPILWSTKVLFLKNWFTHFAPAHCFIKYQDKYYDSECPEGVNYPDELPFYKRELQAYYNYKENKICQT